MLDAIYFKVWILIIIVDETFFNHLLNIFISESTAWFLHDQIFSMKITSFSNLYTTTTELIITESDSRRKSHADYNLLWLQSSMFETLFHLLESPWSPVQTRWSCWRLDCWYYLTRDDLDLFLISGQIVDAENNGNIIYRFINSHGNFFHSLHSHLYNSLMMKICRFNHHHRCFQRVVPQPQLPDDASIISIVTVDREIFTIQISFKTTEICNM